MGLAIWIFLSNLIGMRFLHTSGPEEEIMDDGEVTSPDISGMIPEKCCPGLVRLFPLLGQVPLDGAFADFDPQLEQFSTDSFSPPQAIFLGHLLD